MRQFRSFKVKSVKNEDLPYVRFAILLYFREAYTLMFPAEKSGDCLGESANKGSGKILIFLKKVTNLKNTQEISTLAYIVLSREIIFISQRFI